MKYSSSGDGAFHIWVQRWKMNPRSCESLGKQYPWFTAINCCQLSARVICRIFFSRKKRVAVSRWPSTVSPSIYAIYCIVLCSWAHYCCNLFYGTFSPVFRSIKHLTIFHHHHVISLHRRGFFHQKIKVGEPPFYSSSNEFYTGCCVKSSTLWRPFWCTLP